MVLTTFQTSASDGTRATAVAAPAVEDPSGAGWLSCHNAGMSVHFECRTVVPSSIADTFDRSRSVEQHLESMSGSRERAVAGVRSGLIGEGDTVTWAATHFGIPLRMTSRITEMEFPRRFVDEQLRGPFRFFRHEHLFLEHGKDTLMVDRVSFAAPFGALGVVVERLILRRYLLRLIEERNVFLARAHPGE
jgi:ligand-binding SRPBCC domain-containing protein